jgi:prepilin-type N-terminal cleavage/methylation domain-containing protein
MLKLLRKDQKGFTLLEIMLVVLIIGIIALLALPRLLVTREDAWLNTCQGNMQAIQTQLEVFRWDTGAYPPDLATLDVPRYWPGGKAFPTCPEDGDAYTYAVAAGEYTLTCPNLHPTP